MNIAHIVFSYKSSLTVFSTGLLWFCENHLQVKTLANSVSLKSLMGVASCGNICEQMLVQLVMLCAWVECS